MNNHVNNQLCALAIAIGFAGSAGAFEVMLDQVFIEVDGAAPVANNAEAQVVAMAQLLKPHLVVELSFARRAAKLNDEQVNKLVDAIREGWMEIAKKMARGDNQDQGVVVWLGIGRAARKARGDTFQQLADVVGKALPKVASEQQVAMYTKEIAARDEFRKQATLDEMAAMLDEGLLLNDDQRVKIRESLEAGWQDAWAGNMEALQQYGEQYYPVLPDSLVVPHLNKAQKQRWNSLQKVNASGGIGNNMFGAQAIADVNVPDPKPPKQADREANETAGNPPQGLIRIPRPVPAAEAVKE